MHSQLQRGGAPFLMASDTHQPGTLSPGNNFSIAIEAESAEEGDRLFASLSRGGEVRQPLVEAPWGARFGMLTDQFGIQWMFNVPIPK
jgi:PhnB protein